MKLKTACVLAIAACVLDILLFLANFAHIMQNPMYDLSFYDLLQFISVISKSLLCVFFITLYNKFNNSK